MKFLLPVFCFLTVVCTSCNDDDCYSEPEQIPYDYSTISPDEEAQLIKTYDILFKDFEKSYKEKTN